MRRATLDGMIFFAGLFIMAPDDTLGHSYLELLAAGVVLLIPGILLAKAGRKLMPGVRVRASQKA